MRRLDKTSSSGTTAGGSEANRTEAKGVRRWRYTLIWMGLLVVIGVVISVFLDSRSGILQRIPLQWIHMIKAVLVLIIGVVISQLLERGLFRFPVEKLGPQRSTMVRYLTRLLLFTVISVAVLTAFGVGVPSVIFGGTFLTVIIGLAGQTIFSNIIGGIWLIFVRPFHIGDSIGIVAWQFPLLMPSFPHEATRPAYYGRVQDINLMYTEILNQDGYPQLIPNGIIAQSFLENRTHEGAHRVHLRFDVALEVDSVRFMEELRRRLEAEFAAGEGWTGENGGVAPGVTSGAAPGVASGTAPGVTSGVASGAAPGMASGAAAGVAQGMASGAAPGVAPGVAQGADRGVVPGVAPGTAARTVLESVPSPVEVAFADVYPTAYSVAVNIRSREKEERVRDRVLALAVRIIQELRPGTDPDPRLAVASDSTHGPAR